MIKIILICVSFLPLLLHSTYLWQTWTGSRLDHWDWIFFLLSIPATFWAIHKEKFEKCDFCALLMLIPCLILTLLEQIHHINALAVASAVCVIFSAVWLLGSWNFAYKVLPITILLLLGTPSSSYQLSLVMMCPVATAWAVKFLLAVLCLIWIWYTKRTGVLVKCSTIFFLAAALVTGLILLHSKALYFKGTSFIPEFPAHCGEFWGRSIQPDANTKRFFVTSTVKQYRYTKADTEISVLAVECGENIHEIHPASHCLRTSRWVVTSEKMFRLRDDFAVTEIEAHKGNYSALIWVWYSSDEFSTPGFLGFRRKFRNNGKYHTFQISISIGKNVETSRDVLKNFIDSLEQKKIK